MIPIRIHDGNFVGSTSSSLYHSPKRLRWLREGQDTPVVFYTDMLLDQVNNARPGTYKIAWILEPSEINAHPYHHVVEHADKFDLILTHHADMLRHGPKFVYYPNGMSWIADSDWRQHAKSKLVSMIASGKRTAVGHRMRHSVVQKAGRSVTVFGRGYRPVEHKIEALGPYRFSVVIENCAAPWYFTEKLLDCFATYTVPIYWGCPGIAKFFDTSGMIVASSEDELVECIEYAEAYGEFMYEKMLPAMAENHKRAARYKVAEDWIFDNILVERGIIQVKL